jgi:transposase-like protein
VVGATVSSVLNTDTLTPRERGIQARRAKVASLYNAGASVAEISRVLDVTRSAVYQMLKTLDLPAPTQRNEKAS